LSLSGNFNCRWPGVLIVADQFVVEAKKERAVGLPNPTLATVFEVVAAGKIYHVSGAALQRWIADKRSTWKGPKGYMFCQRPGLE
jgi:hypothetical protein